MAYGPINVPDVASVTVIALSGMSDPGELSAARCSQPSNDFFTYQAEHGSRMDSMAGRCRGQMTIAGVMMWSPG